MRGKGVNALLKRKGHQTLGRDDRASMIAQKGRLSTISGNVEAVDRHRSLVECSIEFRGQCPNLKFVPCASGTSELRHRLALCVSSTNIRAKHELNHKKTLFEGAYPLKNFNKLSAMDFPETVKAGPSATQASLGTRISSKAKHARNLLTAASALLILALLYVKFGGYFLDPLSSRSSLLLGNDGGRPQPGGLRGDQYLLGVGKADITGPVVEINMMGYADTKQLGSGLRQRLYSRAFIIGDIENPDQRFAYLVLDTQSGDTAIRYGILEGLAKLGEDYLVYSQQNLAVTGTHSHSGPGAWLNYLLPQITSKGFSKQSYDAIVRGAVLSIQRAHETLQPGYLTAGHTKVKGANINRSLYAYLANPEQERAEYDTGIRDDGSVEKTMTLLRFTQASTGKHTGVLTWFPVHGTSMLGNNTLISGDNKGVAADLFEKNVRGDKNVAENFVAGFSQASVGDTSPNVLGAWCEDGTGDKCSFENGTCANGRGQDCHARGPFFRVKDNGASSCYEIGQRQFKAAKSLYDRLWAKGTAVVGSSVRSFHTFHDMSNFSFPLENGTLVHTCPAALGYSFAAGTSDGPGAFDFTQNNPNEPSASPVWSVVRGLLKAPSEDQKRCHFPKPILLDVGEMTSPYLWTPNVVDVQVFRVGQLFIIVSPGEATTMAGRRWKSAVRSSALSLSLSGSSSVDPVVVLGGPANSYTHYISTPEEYSVQRYEGASTLYGPYTLNAYINVTLSYLPYLATSSTSRPNPGPLPPNNVNRSLSFISGVVYDGTPLFKSFGDVIDDVDSRYRVGDVVRATFVGANPRNNLRLEETFAAVEACDHQPGRPCDQDGSKWKLYRDDSDWDLVFHWEKTSEVMGTSEVRIVWETKEGTGPGTYRIRYFGDSRAVGGSVTPFEGVSGNFVLE